MLLDSMLIEWEIHSMVIIFRSIRGFNGDYMGFNMGIQCGDFIVANDFGWYTFRYIGIQPATQNYVFKMRLTNQNGDSPLMILLGIEWAYHRGLEPMIKYQFVGWCVVLLIFLRVFYLFREWPWTPTIVFEQVCWHCSIREPFSSWYYMYRMVISPWNIIKMTIQVGDPGSCFFSGKEPKGFMVRIVLGCASDVSCVCRLCSLDRPSLDSCLSTAAIDPFNLNQQHKTSAFSVRIGYNLLLRSCMHASDWQRAKLGWRMPQICVMLPWKNENKNHSHSWS